MKRTRCFQLTAALACALYAWAPAHAQTFPSKPVRLLVGFAAGGGADGTARLIAGKLSADLKQPVVVENRPGASSAISLERVASAPPDGYTLGLLTSAALLHSALHSKVSYNLERDFAPVSLVAVGPFVLVVHPSLPVRNVKELIALARAQPGKLSYGSAGVGSTAHFAGEFFNLMAKVKIVHVPYKGSAPASTATAIGEVEMSYPSLTGALPLLNAKKIKALAVTSAKRTTLMPDTPSLHEQGLTGYDRSGSYGILATAGTPKDVVARLNAAIATVVNAADMKPSFHAQGLEPQTNAPAEYAAFIARELAAGAQFVKLTGAKGE